MPIPRRLCLPVLPLDRILTRLAQGVLQAGRKSLAELGLVAESEPESSGPGLHKRSSEPWTLLPDLLLPVGRIFFLSKRDWLSACFDPPFFDIKNAAY
jgi:hypothetical protein